jgi:two-component system, OmpR family, sensor kinase
MAEPSNLKRSWRTLRTLPARTPLRVKLITAVLTLVAIALVVISVVGISALSRVLLGQANGQIETLYQQAQSHRHFNENAIGPQLWVYEAAVPNENHGQPFQVGGNLAQGPGQPDGPGLSASSVAWLTGNAGHALTVPDGSGGGEWRVVAYPNFTFFNASTEQPLTGTLFVAVDVSGVYSTISQLAVIDLIVSVLLLLLLLIAGIAVVRASLRPLTSIERTAGAIAKGDLTRRVPELDPRTEVGRLAQSLNAMLSQIETAFDARAESEFAARRSEERMRQFVADASHELRTPLTAIRGYAEYYRQRGGVNELSGSPAGPALTGGNGTDAATGPWTLGSGPEASGPLARADVDRIMQRVEQESSRMGVLVEDMLLLARLDQQRPLERGTVDMLTLAADAVNDARVIAPDRNINLTVGSGTALLVLGDEVRLRQVIGNLMSNALNHTPDASPIEARVRLGRLDEWRIAAQQAGRAEIAAARPEARPTPAVVFEVADRGPGLTPEQAEHVFERFYRGDQARTRKAGGTGLGLAIVAALVGAHGGAVWVESPPGGGATFHIAIPLAPEARYSGPEPDDSTDPGTALPPALGGFAAPGPGPGPGAVPGSGPLARTWRTSGQPRRGEAPSPGPLPPAPPPPPPPERPPARDA